MLHQFLSQLAYDTKPIMIFHKLQRHVELSTCLISTAACAYVAYNITEPKPMADIKFINDANAAFINIKSTNNATIKDATVIHRNLDCLQNKGYIVKRLCTHPSEPMVYIENAENHYSISEDFTACRVATEIEYSSLFGRRKELLEWAPQANYQLRVPKHQ
jgi:hypothetical protein